jgi:acyl-CoA synthetase (AMP-forming)/AMP-acid ligase II
MERVLNTLDTPLYSVYGMTEMSGVFCVLGPDEHRDPKRKYLHGSAGRAVPGVEVRVVDPSTGEDVPTGDVGEFWLRSEQAMSRYWHQPEASEAAFVDGWLRTGDAGRLDENGYLFIEDRVKDMVISGGKTSIRQRLNECWSNIRPLRKWPLSASRIRNGGKRSTP